MSKFGNIFEDSKEQVQIKPLSVSSSRFGGIFEDDEDEKEIQQYNSDAVGIDAWAQDESKMSSLSTYMKKRFGQEEGEQKEDETNEQYVNRFASHASGFENNSVGLMSQIDYLRKADDNSRIEFGEMYDEYLKLPSFWQEGGRDSVKAVRDTVGQLIFDPINIFSAGVGRLAASTVGKVAVKEGLKRFIPKSAIARGATAAGAVTAGETALFDVGLQDVERKGYIGGKTPEDGIDLFRTLVAGGIGGVLGGVIGGVASIGAGKSAKKLAQEGARKADKKNVESMQNEMFSQEAEASSFDAIKGPTLSDATKTIKRFNEKKAKAQKEQGVQYTPDGVYKDTPFLEPQILVDLSRRMSRVVYRIAEQDPEMLTKYSNTTKISNIVKDTLENIKDVDVDILETALSKEKISKNDFLDFMEVTDGFANMKRGTTRDAARQLQADSALGKMRKAIIELAPAEQNRIDKIFGQPEETTSALGYFYKGFKRLDRERRALMVTQIATTARNVATGLAVITTDTVSNLVESALYHAGKGFRAAIDGRLSLEGSVRGLYDVGKDALALPIMFVRQGRAKEMTDFLLEDNPRLAKILDRTLQEVGEGEGLSSFSRAMNTLNIMQDKVFRRAFFAHSIDKKLRRAGVGAKAGSIYKKTDGSIDVDRLSTLQLDKDSYVGGLDYLYALDKNIDTKYLKDAIDESLKNTFSFMPKKGPAHHFIKAIEGLPGVPVIGTGEFPFARFMANAMMFQFKYSPLNGAGAVANYAIKFAGRGFKTGAMTPADNQMFREKLSQGLVGTAALYTAIEYRSRNQDTKWYEAKNNEGKILDLRPFFPLAPYLIVADAWVKVANGETEKLSGRDILEGFTGAQFRAGAASYTIDRFYELLGQEGDVTGEQIGETVGRYAGELVGGALTPLRVLKDINAAFDEDAAILRDSRQIEGEGGVERGVDVFLKTTLHKNLPNIVGLEDDIPEYVSPTRDEPIRFQSPLLGQILGLRFKERRTPVETELTRLGYENFEIFRTTGDRETDNLIKKELAPLVENLLGQYVETKAYNSLTEPQKQTKIGGTLKLLRAFAKKRAKLKAQVDTTKEFTPFERTEFNRLPRKKKALANEYFMKNFGVTIEESKRYREGKFLALELSKLYD